jgi:hypothetical protein
MQAVIDRVMETYGMLVKLTPDQERATRDQVSEFLAKLETDDDNRLAVEGLRYLKALNETG